MASITLFRSHARVGRLHIRNNNNKDQRMMTSLMQRTCLFSAILNESVRALSTTITTSAASHLQDASLLGWEASSSSESFAVTDPASPQTILAEVPSMNAKDAIDKSDVALPAWRDDTTAAFRGSLLTQWSHLIKENLDDLATIMTLESGKPLAEAKGEVNYATSFLDYYAAEAIRPTGAGGGFVTPSSFATPSGAPRGQILAIQQAVGVTAMITPWNFPMAMTTRKVGPALAAGCTAIVKPSELTPLSAIALWNLANRAGIPQDVFQLVTAAPGEPTIQVGTEFCTNPNIQKISFTGSTNVGKLLMRQSSDTVKRLSLELGGNAPFVVFDDADIDVAVDAAMASKFRNAGQTCVCADRFLIQASVHDEFVDKFVQKTSQLKVGPGMDPTTTMGPLITSMAAKNVAAKVQDAIENGGASCMIGGSIEWGGDETSTNFYPPTILTNVSTKSKIWNLETFGPVAPIMSFETEQEALEIANDASVGLASYFCTKDLSRAFRFAQKLECGIVGVNDGIISSASAPFGGIKESGLGREGSALGLSEYLETKYIFMNTS